ncbi:MAG TPA: malonyl-[acyl-carrier protein] O-methyltransferase BioC [Acidiferrobacteraceae bacterium]|nr:malonyl-[acyl-carrier protein] O-methyltransferase BioC [Acidiferrobacteraceae bacterium]
MLVDALANIEKAQARRAFSQAASRYDDVAVLHQEIGRRMLERLDEIKLRPQQIVDAGCGTGYCLPGLGQRYDRAPIVAMDFALPMLGQAARHRNRRSKIQLLAGDLEAMPIADNSVDLLFSNLALQWCRPDRVFAQFSRVLKPGGLLLFTTFGPDTLIELRNAWRQVDDGLHVHGFADMHDLGDMLLRAGFSDPVMDVEHHTLTYAAVNGLLQDLKTMGAHNALASRQRGLTGKTQFTRFRAAYEALRDEDGRIPASYEVVYGHAWVPQHPTDSTGVCVSVSVPEQG